MDDVMQIESLILNWLNKVVTMETLYLLRILFSNLTSLLLSRNVRLSLLWNENFWLKTVFLKVGFGANIHDKDNHNKDCHKKTTTTETTTTEISRINTTMMNTSTTKTYFFLFLYLCCYLHTLRGWLLSCMRNLFVPFGPFPLTCF